MGRMETVPPFFSFALPTYSTRYLRIDGASDEKLEASFAGGPRTWQVDRDAVGGEDPLRFGPGEDGAALCAGRAQERVRLAVGAGVLVAECRRLVQAAQVVRVLPHVVEDPRRGIRVPEAGNAGLGEDAAAGRHLAAPHPAREHRLVETAARVGFHPLRGGCRLGGVLWREGDEE